jgi:hypothetical protein
MPYTSEKPKLARSSDELRAAIPGWGADLDPKDRPAFPREQFLDSGAHWDFPERQPEKWPRERSIEHTQLPPVFGTSTPPTGLSGAIRRYAYREYSEGRAAHWLLLVLGDRVDAVEQHLKSFLTFRPDNPITETGVLSEVKHHPISSRFGTDRVDTKHQWLDPILVAGPWVIVGTTVVLLVRSLLGSGKK